MKNEINKSNDYYGFKTNYLFLKNENEKRYLYLSEWKWEEAPSTTWVL